MSRRSALLREARDRFEVVASLPFTGFDSALREAGDLVALARAADDRLLEAEALVWPYRHLNGAPHPQRALIAARRAREIFAAYGQPDRAAACELVNARALFDLGHELAARSLLVRASAALALPAGLVSNAQSLHALCLARLGWLHAAHDVIERVALPLAERSGDDAVASLVHHRHGLVRLRAWLRRERPRLSCGLPDLPPIHDALPDAGDALAPLERALQRQPSGWPEGSLRTSLAVAQFLLRPEVDAAPTRTALLDVADGSASSDPATAARALLCVAEVDLDDGRPDACAETLARAKTIVEACGLAGLGRGLLRLQAEASEAQGQLPQALDAQRQLARLQVFGLLGPAAEPAQPAPESPARTLEPAHVRRAVRLIDECAGIGITVREVALQCGVARRTLETAFRAHRGTSIAEYIRRQKLQRAARWLGRVHRSVREVAQAVGYRSTAAFGREFRRQFGMPPTDWMLQRHEVDELQAGSPDAQPPEWSPLPAVDAT